MALKPKFEYQPEAYTRVIPRVRGAEKSSGVRFSRGQLLIGTAAMAGSMLAVFLFGFYAGHGRGVEQGLSQGGQLAVRLPVPEQVVAPGVAQLAVDKPVLSIQDGEVRAELPPVPASKPNSGIAGIKERSTIDTLAALSTTPVEAPIAKSADSSGTIGERAPAKAAKSISKTKALDVKKPVAVVKAKAKPLLKVSSKVASGFYIQVAARKDEKGARQLASLIDTKNFPVQIEKAVVKGRKYFRVLVGPYKTRSAALKRQSAVTKAAKQTSKPFIKKVK